MKTPILTLLTLMLLFAACEKDPFEASSGTFTDERDGREYKWVKIGDQIWMAENLAYVPYVCAPDSQCGIWVYDYYGKGSFYENYTIYGCLYDWETAQTACPEGWHLPSDEEWMELERFLGMEEDQLDRIGIIRGAEANVGGKLKKTGLLFWEEPNEGATNEIGFSALPGGCRSTNYRFGSLHNIGYFWTSTISDNSYSIYRSVNHWGKDFDRAYRVKDTGLSVRCIKN